MVPPKGGPSIYGLGDAFDEFRWLDLWYEMEYEDWLRRQPA